MAMDITCPKIKWFFSNLPPVLTLTRWQSSWSQYHETCSEEVEKAEVPHLGLSTLPSSYKRAAFAGQRIVTQNLKERKRKELIHNGAGHGLGEE